VARREAAEEALDRIAARSALLSTPEILRRNPQRAVELRRGIFPRDDFRQLDDGIVIEAFAHAREELVRNIAAGDRDRVRELEDEPLDFIEEWRCFPIRKCQ
jgi:hypothetical protein